MFLMGCELVILIMFNCLCLHIPRDVLFTQDYDISLNQLITNRYVNTQMVIIEGCPLIYCYDFLSGRARTHTCTHTRTHAASCCAFDKRSNAQHDAACVHVCVHACMCVCMRACVCACVCARVCVHMHVFKLTTLTGVP